MIRGFLRAFFGLAVLMAILVMLAVGWWIYSECASSGTLPNGIVYTRHTLETTRPLTVDEARKHWKGFAFPDTASNIHIAAYHEWQAVEEVVRFEAPPEDCLATARAIFGKDIADSLARPIPANKVPEFHGDVLLMPADRTHPQLTPLKAPWFTPNTIRVGTEILGHGEYVPLIWIDTERGIFYFHRSQ